MERMAAELARQSQVVVFDTAPALIEADRHLRIRCRNFRVVRAVQSADASALVSDVERPTTRLTDVIGARAAKEALAFIRDWLREPRKYAVAGVEPPRGILLTGPPGTGKTMLARALAGESDCAFLVESATGFVTMWQGSGPENVRQFFARARRYAPSVVFIDEIDAIGAHRAEVRPGAVGHGEMLALNALLAEMDGFAQTPTRPVVVIAATNHPEKLDPGLVRRFSRVIEVELPTRAERELYLTARLEAKTAHRVSPPMIQRLAAQSARMSIADLDRILAHAAIMALGNEGVIDDAIIGEAFETVTMGEAKAGGDPLRTARHEGGHALVMCLTGAPPVHVTIVGRGAFGGYVAPEEHELRGAQTKGDLEDRVCHLVGGHEAERLFYGPGGGESTGASNDLERATAIAEAMVHELGMAEEVGFVRVDRSRPLPEELGIRCHAAVRRILAEQSKRAQQLLTEHRETLERIVAALVERNRLLKDEVLGLLTPEERAHATGTEA
jgi:ATP-dependent metalloprotease FtsH